MVLRLKVGENWMESPMPIREVVENYFFNHVEDPNMVRPIDLDWMVFS
jgi:hypothetical protein